MTYPDPCEMFPALKEIIFKLFEEQSRAITGKM